MSYSWRVFVALLLLGLFHLLLGPKLNINLQGDITGRGRHKYAYVTLLCDDVMAEAAMVLVHSVKKTGTPHDMVILTMNVSNKTIQALQHVGAIIEPITEPVPYPFTVTADRKAINKPCRYSKILMWNMLQYKKMVYLDSDLLLLHNIDELFLRPQLSAVPDTLPPDKFNSGLMVVEPNRATYKDMLAKVATTISPNVGDQGFLNSYFADWYRQPAEHHLDYGYNALVRVSVSPVWPKFIAPNLKVLHFSGNTKPWNMMIDKQFPTTRQFDHLWWDTYDDVYKVLARKALESAGNSTPVLPPQLTPQCQRDYMAYARGRLVRNRLSVVMNCFDRFDLMRYMVRRYAALDFVHKIYIVWGNTHVTPLDPASLNASKPVEILYSGIDSLNDRFKPIRSLETEAVLMCDDDIEVDVGALRVAFARWQDDPYRLVGFFPRAHYRDPATRQLVYVLTPRMDYSIVLTKMFLMHADYLRAYTCAVPAAMLDYVDEHKNCEDITMNFLVTQLSGLPPLLMEDPSKLDYGTTSGLSSRGSHDFSRSVCMNDIERILGYMSLRNSSSTVTLFERDKAVKISVTNKRRLVGAGARLEFKPVYDAAEHSSSKQFMKQVAFSAIRSTADVAEVPSDHNHGVVLCVKGDNDDDPEDTTSNQYTLLEYASVPPDAAHLSGTTFVIHSPVGFEGRFVLLHLLAGFLPWRREHGCFGPARVMLYHDGELRTQPSPWATAVIKSVLGPAAQPYKPGDAALPECMEKAVVARQRDTFVDECDPTMREMRRTIHAFCRSMPSRKKPPVSILNDQDANVRIAIVGDAANWLKADWFNYTYIQEYVEQECTDMGLSCQIANVPRGDFCNVKVLGLSRADLLIGPWGDHAMDNVVFLKPGTAVLEMVPASLQDEERRLAKKEVQCLDLRYDQLQFDSGFSPLLSWVSRQLDLLGRQGRRYGAEEASFLETCVTRNLRF